MAQPVMQTSFNSGEWAPTLNARVDIDKYHSGAALLENFFVDYRGGATARGGTRYIYTSQSTGTIRLIPFQASFTVSYILEFGSGYIGFINNGAQVISGGTPYTIASPYTGAELAHIKFTQDVNVLILCHPNHPPYQLTLISATNWTLTPIVFGTTVGAPTGVSVATTLGAGAVNYAYIVTAVDSNGEESSPSSYGTLGGVLDLRTTPGTNTVTWNLVPGASSYDVYKAEPRYGAVVPPGSVFGFVGNVTGLTFIDSNVEPDFSQGPPVPQNPFFGSGVQTITLTAGGSYGGGVVFPTIAISGGGGSGATASAFGKANAVAVAGSSSAWAYPGDTLALSNGVIVQVTAITGLNINPPWGVVSAVAITNPGTIASGNITPGPQVPTYQNTRSGNSIINAGFTIALGWTVTSAGITSPGTSYTSAPAAVFSSGTATATTTLGAASSGNPTVPSLFQQRLALLGPTNNPQQANFSSTGDIYNFNIHSPIEADDAIEGTLTSGQLNTIQSAITMPQGLVVFSDKQAFLINGGGAGTAISPLPGQFVANSHSYNGATFVPPIVASDNILYVQAKGSIVRNLVFNYYTQVYTGTDISILSSHLFYGFSILEWAWAEEPFKIVWAVRNDGALLSLTYLKEQELVAWGHSITQGAFKSIATVTETAAIGAVDAIYVVVQRSVNGAIVQYIERMVEQYYPSGATTAWQVDAGIQYNGPAVLSFSGAAHLAGLTVTGIATDDTAKITVIPPFVMPVSGAFTLPAPPAPAIGYARVTVGIPYTPKLQTLGIDVGNPTIQGKMKKLPEVTVRVNNTLGLSIGTDFNNLVDMEDLIIGNVGKDTNALVTNLVTGDAKQSLDPAWTVPGQYCIQQNLPYPVTILGLIPQIAVGDTKDAQS